MNKKLDKLEAIRGIAALYVVIHHLFNNTTFLKGYSFSFLFIFGQEAVILFFILSGFVIEYSFSKTKDKSFNTYFFKRFNRIYIPLLLVFAANFLIFYYQGKIGSFDFKTFIGNLFMLQDLPRVPNIIVEPFLGNTPLWSLAYEWWFYMIFFLVFYFFKDKTSKIIYAAGIIATISYIFYPFWGNRIFMYLMIWNLGADLAGIYLRTGTISFKDLKYQAFLMLGIILLLCLNFYLNKVSVHEAIHFDANVRFGKGASPALEVRHFAFALFSILAGVAWLKLRWIGFKYTIGVFEPLAKISYCIYISHFFLIIKASYLSFIGNRFIELCLYGIICFIFSYLVEVIIYPRLNKFIMKKKALTLPKVS